MYVQPHTKFPLYLKNQIAWRFPVHIRNISQTVPNHIQNYSVTFYIHELQHELTIIIIT